MTGSRVRPRVLVGLFLALLAIALQGVQGEEVLADQVPSEVQCRPYIEKALKGVGTGSFEESSIEVGDDTNNEEPPLNEQDDDDEDGDNDEDDEAGRIPNDSSADEEVGEGDGVENDDDAEQNSGEDVAEPAAGEEAEEEDDGTVASNEKDDDGVETVEVTSAETAENETAEDDDDDDDDNNGDDGNDDNEEEEGAEEADVGGEEQDDESAIESIEAQEDNDEDDEGNTEEEDDTAENKKDESEEDSAVTAESEENEAGSVEGEGDSVENKTEENNDEAENDSKDDDDGDSEINETEETNLGEDVEAEAVSDDAASLGSVAQEVNDDDEDHTKEETDDDDDNDDTKDEDGDSKEDTGDDNDESGKETTDESIEEEQASNGAEASKEDDAKSDESEEVKSRDRRDIDEEPEQEDEADDVKDGESEEGADNVASAEKSEASEDENAAEPTPEEDLIQEIEVPENLRPRDHINQLLKLDEENEVKERAIQRAADIVLRDLKRLYDTAIKPLETLYKYRDLSNRHFGDPEIFSKPLVLFMGPWSGGKSSIINYLLDNEYKQTSLRTGAEPSPAYFNILMHGEEEEILDGTQLAADWTFSGLQKFGQGMLDRLRGVRLNNPLLEKVNIVEIPGILEIRKQVQRLFPFNDACQWFIDRADIIFLVYDPAKLDVGPETEAILDQLKGREYQTRIILNKADQVKPEELMRVQGALIWNISPLMSSAEPPVMYSTSLWSVPYEAGAPTRLLYAQERAFLRDLRSAIDKRVEHKIASARRFAVRVRNHAKMVDCYLTTYYNHKGFFGNKKEISDKIIQNPQDYHIYEGLSTLTNISRYDLPDPEVYKDFFRLNSLYDFQQLSATCTYFRGCPINRLDVAIAYDLPELVGKYKKSVEAALHEEAASTPPS